MGVQVDLLAQNSSYQDYINFEFDGKKVSEFGLVVVSDGDRLSFAGSAEFEDEVSSINGVNGQYYWGTNFKSLKRNFTLATDGMTEAQVQAFKYHFRPGRYGKFMEPHFPFRESYCRVAAVTEFSMVPFRKQISTSYKDNKGNAKSSTTWVNEYKGEVKLTLEWDYPYSTSTIQYIADSDYDTITKFNNVYPAVFANNVPLESSLASSFLMAENSVLGLGVLGKMILGSGNGICDFHLGADKKLRYTIGSDNSIEKSQLVAEKDSEGNYTPDEGATYVPGMKVFYNPSTAITRPKVTFIMDLTTTKFRTDGPVYFNDIADKYNYIIGKSENSTHTPVPYNAIQLSTKKIATIAGDKAAFVEDDTGKDIAKEFFYSSPNVISSIHKAIEIAWKYKAGNSQLLEEELRQEISHHKVLQWAIAALAAIYQKGKYYNKSTGNFIKNGVITVRGLNLKPILGNNFEDTYDLVWCAYFNVLMLYFFTGKRHQVGVMADLETSYTDKGAPSSGWQDFGKFKIIFDSENSNTFVSYSTANDNYQSTKEINRKWINNESSGDMLYSGYLIFDGGNTINQYGQIESCYFLKFLKGGAQTSNIDNIGLEYKYTYL